MRPVEDRRVARTRTALIDAFNHLVLARRQKRIRVSDIVALANVGRSTFYEHYASADDLHMQALSRPMAALADAAAGEGDADRLRNLLAHFWENRQRARETFGDRAYAKVCRLLADMVATRLEARQAPLILPTRLAAVQLAEASLAPLRAWLAGEAPCTSEALAAAICRTAEHMIAALSEHPVAGAVDARR